MKYVTFATSTQSSCMIGLIPNISPLVQSGDMSQLASIMAGDTMIVSRAKMILSPATRLSYIFLISASAVDFGLAFIQGIGALAQSQPSPAYTLHPIWSVTREKAPLGVFSQETHKNPIIPTRSIHIYVAIFFCMGIYIY